MTQSDKALRATTSEQGPQEESGGLANGHCAPPVQNEAAIPQVLLVSDSESVLNALQSLPVGESCQRFVSAASMEEAIACMEQSDIDAALVDLATPSGFQSLSSLTVRYPGLPIVGLGPDDNY